MMTIPKRRWRNDFEDELLTALHEPQFSSEHPQETGVRSEDAVVLRGVYKSFLDRGQRHEALRGVDLRLKRGEIHGILGPSGAGKTTLLRCLLRLEQPDAGEILIDGRDWAALSDKALRSERHRVGVVFQHLNLLASRTAAANVSLPLEIAGRPAEERHHRVHELLKWFGIAEKAREYPSRLSGGQRQRVALARALATSPSVLLADEPTSALDTETKLSVLNILQRIRDDFGVTILIITHDLQAASAVCDTLSLLESGRIVESGLTQEVVHRPRTLAARRFFAPTHSPSSTPPLSGHLYSSFEHEGGL
jgi:D-methionine transport system ATP-binding protein